MQADQGADQPADAPVLHAKTDNVKVICDVLQTIALKKHQIAFVTITAAGLKVTVQNGRTLQASALLRETLFHSYSFNGGGQSQVVFHIDLALLLNCLGLACNGGGGAQDQNASMGGAGGGFTMMQMLFASEGAPLDLLLEDAGVVTECRIATIEPEGNLLPLDFGFKAVPSRNNIIMHSEPLKEALMEIQQLDKTVSVHITVSPADPNLSLFAQGSLSSFEVQLADTSEAFFKFECAEETTQSFNMAFVKATLPALTASKEVRLRINTYGMLSLVAVITTDDEQVRTYVEYIIAPEDAGTGDGEDEEEENYGFGGNDAEDNQ